MYSPLFSSLFSVIFIANSKHRQKHSMITDLVTCISKITIHSSGNVFKTQLMHVPGLHLFDIPMSLLASFATSVYEMVKTTEARSQLEAKSVRCDLKRSSCKSQAVIAFEHLNK